MQARAQQVMNDAMQQNVTAGPDGFPVIDHAGVAKHLAEAGAGSAIPGYMQGALKARQEQATAMKTDLGNRDSILTNTAQLLQGVKDDTGYQAVLPHARANLQKLGLDQTLLPDAFDAGRISTAIAAGTKISDFNKQLQQHADLTFKIAGGAPKTIEAWSNNVYKDLSAAGSQGQLEAIKEKYRTLAQNPEFSKYLPQSLVDSIPDQWTPDVPEAAKLRLVAPDKQPGYQQKKRENLASDLLGTLSGGPQAYQAYLDTLSHGRARTLPAAETLFDSTGKPLPEAKGILEKLGMTPEQMAKTEQSAGKAAAQQSHWQGMERIGQQNADTRARAADAAAAGKKASPSQSRIIEQKKQDALQKLQKEALLRIKGDDAKGIEKEDAAKVWEDVGEKRQAIQNAYEAEIAAAGGDPEHYEYPEIGAGPAASKQGATATAPKPTAPVWPPTSGAAQKPRTAAPQAKPVGSGAGKFTVTDPRGVVHLFPSQVEADQFKKKVGIQ